jgi:hypothetical protein
VHIVVQTEQNPATNGGNPTTAGTTTTATAPRAAADDASGFRPGLEGVVAFHTEIAEPDRDGGALRYRGVNIEDLVGRVSFGEVWALLVDGRFGPGLPPAEPFPLPVHTGDVRPCWPPSGVTSRCWTSPTSRPANNWPAPR